MALHPYLPQDRLRALAQDGQGQLPERTQGAALFADISGFTAMTEGLSRTHGERRGIEALSQAVNAVYEGLVTEVERWGGSVVGFAGDAITCWFDATQGDAPLRATVCAQALLAVMHGFPALSLKVGVASGPARRFAIDLNSGGRLDVLAGATVTRAAMGESLATRGQVLLDQATAAQLAVPKGATCEAESGERFFVLPPQWALKPLPTPPGSAPLPPCSAEPLRSWMLPFVLAREAAGEDLFATDLRPATALFMRFGGLDYDRDADAPAALARLLATAQACIEQHGGVLLELTLGDKGSYLYGSFGAARVHEEDPVRAVHAALALREAFAGTPHAVQIGLSCGTLRVGGYGSRSRQSFGAMGDEVNAAARLMGAAAAGDILVSGRLRQALGQGFSLEARPPMPVRGKAEPMPVFAVLGLHRQRPIRLQEPVPALPMVGREAEAAWIARKLTVAQRGQGQVLGLCAEAGMGKSRLMAEAVRLGLRQSFNAYGGQCDTDGMPTPYLVWQPIWSALFDFDPGWPQRKQLRAMAAQLQQHAPDRLDALPLLGRVLGVPWPDSDFTAALTPQDSKALLEAMLLTCLASLVQEAEEDGMALLFAMDDLHAIDPLSLDLLVLVARASAHWPLLMVLGYRPTADAQGLPPPVAERLGPLHHFEAINLGGLDAAQAELLIRAKLAALFPERVGAVPASLIERVTAQAQGNPFFVEELLNYLHDRGLDPRRLDPQDVIALPASLHSLVLSRIDQLPPTQQRTLKVASIIGRLFAAADLQGYHPAVGDAHSLRHNLDELDRLGFTPRADDEVDLSYLFKHLVTLEAGYESMAHSTRVALHAELGHYLEGRWLSHPQAALTPQLAHHFSRAELRDKACHYLTLAGEHAAAQFANADALHCFERALAWLPPEAAPARWALLLRCEALHDLVGDHAARQNDLAAMEALAPALPEPLLRRAEIAIRRAKLDTVLGDYPAAQAHAQAALAALDTFGHANTTGTHEAQHLRVDAWLLAARAMFFSGEAAASQPLLDQALALARAEGYARGEYNCLAQFGLVHYQFGDFAQAHELMQQALVQIEVAGDLRRQIDVLNNLGVVAKCRAQTAQALAFYERAETLVRRIGDRSGQAMLLNNQGNACLVAGDFHQGHECAKRAVALFADLQEPATQGTCMITLGEALRELGRYDEAYAVAHEALQLLQQAQAQRDQAIVLENLGQIQRARGDLADALRYTAQAQAVAQAIGAEALRLSALQNQARIHLASGQWPEAEAALTEAEALLQAQQGRLPGCLQQTLRAQLHLASGAPGAPQAALAAIEPLLGALLGPPDPALQALPMWAQAGVLLVLQAAADPRSEPWARRARAALRARAERIPDAVAQQSFLAIAEHRPLLAV
jgi:adenylate cyclase